MNALSHEQAIALLHEASYLNAEQRAALAAHLAECDRCRNYADQISALQPRLTRALRTHPYAHASEQSEVAQAILQRKRRSVMRKQLTAILGIAAVAVIAIIAVFSTRISTQSMTGAQRVATATPTMTPSPTPTIAPTSTPLSSPLLPKGADRFEPNDNFDQATPIDLNVRYDRLNFAMLTPSADGWDSDYLKVRVKPGMSLTCRTLDLSPGTDTNLILYDENRNGIVGNDNVDPASSDKSSRVGYVATYDGWLYILVGEGFSRSPAEAQQATYGFECSTSAITPTPAPAPVVFPKIDRHPASWGEDNTKSPPANTLPSDEARLMELGKNPGLGIRSLHAKGITGHGVGIAIIDQPLIVDHQEYADRMQLYEEINIAPNASSEMHGPAVASIAVGKTTGVAPEADLYYIACYAGDFDTSVPDGFTYNFHYIARGIQRILDINRQLPQGRKIRVISISVGWSPNQKGYDEVMAAVKEAKAAGLLVVSSSLEETFGFKFQALGREPLADPDQFGSYEPGQFWAKDFYSNTTILGNDHLLVPMDSRTTASPNGPHEYAFYREGGWSWSIPYIAGMYALAAEVKPSITPDEFWSLALKTGRTIQLKHNGETIPFGVILDPATLIGGLQTK